SAGTNPAVMAPSIQTPRSMSLCQTGRPATSAMIAATSATVSASGPVGAYTAPAWAPGSTNVSTATAAVSAAATNASAPPAVDTRQSAAVGGWVIPVERHIGSVPRSCPRAQAPFSEFLCNQ